MCSGDARAGNEFHHEFHREHGQDPQGEDEQNPQGQQTQHDRDCERTQGQVAARSPAEGLARRRYSSGKASVRKSRGLCHFFDAGVVQSRWEIPGALPWLSPHLRLWVMGWPGCHGASHPLTFVVQAHLAGEQLTAETHFTIPYVTWGLKNPSTL